VDTSAHSLALPIPWRIVANGRIAFADEDDGQQFGLTAPIDGEAAANDLIGKRPITNLSVDNTGTADLVIHFTDTVRLDAFSNSSGFEGWHINLHQSMAECRSLRLAGVSYSLLMSANARLRTSEPMRVSRP
jgi:hypothetical protein